MIGSHSVDDPPRNAAKSIGPIFSVRIEHQGPDQRRQFARRETTGHVHLHKTFLAVEESLSPHDIKQALPGDAGDA